MKNNRRILIRIVSHGLYALLKRHSLGIAFYHLGNISNFVSFLLYFWAYSLSTSSLPPLPLPFSLFLFSLFTFFIRHSVRRWQTVVGWSPVFVNKVLEHNKAPSFSSCFYSDSCLDTEKPYCP